MIRQLEGSVEKPDELERSRKLLDQQLVIQDWRIPGVGKVKRAKSIPDNAPSWWRGDEDASQTFMHSMGIVTMNRGRT
jgi:hypothetical protein